MSDRGSLQDAVERINDDGDIDPLVALMAPDMRWSGVSRGWLWWRRAPH